jgi:hypothetical protein
MRILEWISEWPGAVFIRDSGTAYLFVNAAHILGIGLIVGSILPLDLRLLGVCFRTVPLSALAPVLTRAAAFGIVWAILTGLWLFSVKPAEYLGNTAFLCKLALVAAALGNVALQHHSRGYRLAVEDGKISPAVRIRAAVSALLWLSILVAGRWIGFL